MNPRTLLPSALLLTGCASGIDGVWAMYLPYSTEDACVETLAHNFTGATEIGESDTGEDTGWTESETDTRTDRMVFVQIESTGKDAAVLVMGNEAWPGVETAKDQWTFSWPGEEETSTTQSHETGYEYTESLVGSSLDEIKLALTGGEGGGNWLSSTTLDQSWSESDGWSEELTFRNGRIPSHLYLEREAQGGGPGGGAEGPPPATEPATNERDAADCDSDICRLQVTTQCDMDMAVTLVQTDYEAEEVFEYLTGTGQQYGAN